VATESPNKECPEDQKAQHNFTFFNCLTQGQGLLNQMASSRKGNSPAWEKTFLDPGSHVIQPVWTPLVAGRR